MLNMQFLTFLSQHVFPLDFFANIAPFNEASLR